MAKTAEALAVEAARDARIPEVGATVYYCPAQPNVGEDGTPNPADHEEWVAAKVLGVVRIERTDDPDDWQVALDTPVGPIPVAVSLLLPEPPAL